jgi:hypothetical protein
MAREDSRRRPQVREKRIEVEAREVGRGPCAEPDAIAAHEVENRCSFQPAERVDDRPLDQRQPERRDEAIEAHPRAGRMMRCLDRRGEAEGGVGSGVEDVLPRNLERAAKLVEIVLVAQRRRLVEPFRHQELGRNAFALAIIGEPHAGAYECLRRLRECDHAETKRQPQLHRPLVEARLDEAQCRRAHALPASIKPRR